jgi:hypothetical protein
MKGRVRTDGLRWAVGMVVVGVVGHGVDTGVHKMSMRVVGIVLEFEDGMWRRRRLLVVVEETMACITCTVDSRLSNMKMICPCCLILFQTRSLFKKEVWVEDWMR